MVRGERQLPALRHSKLWRAHVAGVVHQDMPRRAPARDERSDQCLVGGVEPCDSNVRVAGAGHDLSGGRPARSDVAHGQSHLGAGERADDDPGTLTTQVDACDDLGGDRLLRTGW